MGTLGAVNSRLRSGGGDLYSSIAWKLRALLDLPLEGRVALVGNVSESWRDSFRSECIEVAECESPKQLGAFAPHTVSCVIWATEYEDTTAGVPHLIRALDPRGVILVLRRNRVAPFCGRRSAALLIDPRARFWCLEKRRLVRAGLHVHSMWLPWPTFECAEEFIFLQDSSELRATAGINSGVWARLRSWAHDGYLILASPDRTSSSHPLRLASVIAKRTDLDHKAIAVSRFDMRERGALVMMLRDNRERRLVARIAHHGTVAEHVSANEWKLRRLRGAAAHCPGVCARLPEPSNSIELNDYVVCLEKRLKGTVSWRVPPERRHRLDRDWMEFLRSLSTIDRVEQVLDHELARAALDGFGRTTESLGLKGNIAAAVSDLERWLMERIVDRLCRFSWSHGDFGYGNLLADSESGELTGVIDWETATEREFCGVDWMNMLIVREADTRGGSIGDAIWRLLHLLSAGDRSGDPVVTRFHQFIVETYGDASWILLLPHIALLRTIQRQARYPQVLRRYEPDYLLALERILSMRMQGEAPLAGVA